MRVTDAAGATFDKIFTINITDVNEAPVLDNTGTMTLTSVTEDQIANAGQTVASIIASAGGDRVTDQDTGAVEGIAITSLSSGNGTWQYSTNGGSAWTDVGTVSDSSALLLRSTDLIRFVPNAQNATTANFTFRAWDQTGSTTGQHGTKVDASVNGGNTSFSTATEDASVTVTAVNDAPVLDNSGTMTLTTITEDETNNAGQTVASIVASAGGDRITDVDTGAVEGIAITSLNSGNGQWQFSTNGGTSWTNVAVVSDANALLLRDIDMIRFLPNGDNATTADFSFRAWDQTSGTQGNYVNVSSNGGTTAFSSETEAASITVTAVNDVPMLWVGNESPVIWVVDSQSVGYISLADFSFTYVGESRGGMVDVMAGPSGQLWGTTANSLFAINSVTGSASNASLSTPNGWGSAGNSDGSAYYLASHNNIWAVDPATGATTLHNSYAQWASLQGDIEVAGTTAFLATNAGLARIDNFRQVGESVTMVAFSGASTVHWGLAFHGGTLYGLTNNRELVTINTTTGVTSLVAANAGNPNAVQFGGFNGADQGAVGTTNFTTTYTENAPSVSIISSTSRLADFDNSSLASAAITLTNRQGGSMVYQQCSRWCQCNRND